MLNKKRRKYKRESAIDSWSYFLSADYYDKLTDCASLSPLFRDSCRTVLQDGAPVLDRQNVRVPGLGDTRMGDIIGNGVFDLQSLLGHVANQPPKSVALALAVVLEGRTRDYFKLREKTVALTGDAPR